MSSTARARIGTRAEALVAEIEALMAQLAPAGRLVGVVASTALIARRGGQSLSRHAAPGRAGRPLECEVEGMSH